MTIKVKVIGSVDVDSGTLMIGDPCYFLGDSWGEDDYSKMCDDFYGDRFTTGEKDHVALHHNYERNTGPGKGVAFGAAWGDGSYPVIGIWDYDDPDFPYASTRPSQVIVDTNPSFDENDEYVFPKWLKA